MPYYPKKQTPLIRTAEIRICAITTNAFIGIHNNLNESDADDAMIPGESQTSTNADETASTTISKWRHAFAMRYQYFLDKSTPHVLRRWIAFAVIFCIYALRVFMIQGFYIITYGLGIFVLNLLIGFLSPQVDPEMEGPRLPTKGSDEFRPFVRRLPEFKFWYGITMAFCVAFVLTFFDALDVPVFWPILLMYWLILFISTMKRQLMHMVKYKYVPFSVGKQRYFKKRSSASEEADSS